MASRSRKRAFDQMEDADTTTDPSTDLLSRVRNTWKFACLMQYIQIFGSALKIDNELDVEVRIYQLLRMSAGCVYPEPNLDRGGT